MAQEIPQTKQAQQQSQQDVFSSVVGDMNDLRLLFPFAVDFMEEKASKLSRFSISASPSVSRENSLIEGDFEDIFVKKIEISSKSVKNHYFLLYCLCFCVSGAIAGSSGAILPLFSKQLNETASQVSMIYTFCFTGYGLSCIICGILANVMKNTHYFFGFVSLISCILMFTMNLVDSLYIMMIYWFMLGMILGCTDTLGAIYVFTVFKPDGASILAKLYAILYVFIVCSPFFCKYAITWYIIGSLGAIFAVGSIFVLKTPQSILSETERKKKKTEKKPDGLENISTMTMTAEMKETESAKQNFEKMIANPNLNDTSVNNSNFVIEMEKKEQEMHEIEYPIQSTPIENSSSTGGDPSPVLTDETETNKNMKNVAKQSKIMEKLFLFFSFSSLVCCYFGNRMSIAFCGYYFVNIINFENSETKSLLVADTIISIYYSAMVVICVFLPYIMKKMSLNKIIIIDSWTMIVCFGGMILLQYIWIEYNNSNLIIVCMFVSFFIRGLADGANFQLIISLISTVMDINGYISMGVYVSISIGLSCSGYIAGMVFDQIGYYFLPHLSLIIVIFQLIFVIMAMIIANKIQIDKKDVQLIK